MFSKLLKYEWKANASLLSILSLCALGVGGLGAGLLRAIAYTGTSIENKQIAAIAVSGLSSMLVFVGVALVAYALAVQFITFFRFYKNKFTDQGYLTFTLPVTARQIFLSSFLNILIWLVISIVVLLCAGGIIVFAGIDAPWEELKIIFSEMGNGLQGVQEYVPGLNVFFTVSILHIFVAPVYAIVLLMTSITLGCVVAKKHKILATIGMYYCINMVVNIIGSVLSIIPTILMLGSTLTGTDDYFYYMALSAGLTLLLELGLTVGGYFWSVYLMKHKLNLP